MGFIQVENLFLCDVAIPELRRQAEEIGYEGEVGLSVSGTRLMKIADGQYNGRITVAARRGGEYAPDERFTPAHCYDLIPRGMEIATAVNAWLWLDEHRSNPFLGGTAVPDWPNIPEELNYYGTLGREDLCSMYNLLCSVKADSMPGLEPSDL